MTAPLVLSVASEYFPLVKTGGLADVTGALPAALIAQGISIRSLIPGYPKVLDASKAWRSVHDYPNLFGGPARLLEGKVDGLFLFAIEAAHLYARGGNPYLGADGRDWPDNAFRFAALAQVAADIGAGLLPGFQPDIVHAHDWQAGLMPAYLHYRGGRRPGTVMTIHNMAFPGQFPATLLTELGLPASAYAIDGVEYYGSISYLKAGLQFADRITTVSPTYAQEIQTPEGGMGLDGLLRRRADALIGILNGIDTAVWNPASDPLIPASYDRRRPQPRTWSKAELQSRFGLKIDPNALLFGVISRLTQQKGLDLLLDLLWRLPGLNAQLALLGNGEAALEAGYKAGAAADPGRIGCSIGYSEDLAHLIQAGADAILVPSRFEPCGLTQLCALRYGAIPVVSRVGGLADTVIDANEAAIAADVATGVQFAPVTHEALDGALRRTAALYRDQAVWRRMQRNGMSADQSWTRPAGHYARLYRELAGSRS